MTGSTVSSYTSKWLMKDISLHLAMFVVVLISNLIGVIRLPLGSHSIILLPLIWAALIGACTSVFVLKFSASSSTQAMRIEQQHRASKVVQVTMLLFLGKLGLLAGSSLPQLGHFGPSLLLQEIGHILGTSIVALPIALLLGIKREAIGSTFSVGREPSLGIIAERFGMSSPEGRGVLAEYIASTVFGVLFISILASIVASMGIFDYQALAMGSGIGSSGMMAAASGAIAAAAGDPATAKEVAALASASNLITNLIGTYCTVFISLPFVQWLYKHLEPKLGRYRHNQESSDDMSTNDKEQSSIPLSKVASFLSIISVVITSLICGVWLQHSQVLFMDVVGASIIVLIALAAICLRYFLPIKIPAVCWVSLIGMLVAAPYWPGAHWINDITHNLDFISLAVPVLAYAGLSVGKDMTTFKKLGWRLALVSAIANAGSFLGAALIAQFFI